MTIGETREWQEVGLSVKETKDGLVIKQGDEKYLARDWTLCPDVIKTIDRALNAGLRCLIREKHPRPKNRLTKGVEHIGFSTSPDEPWVFVIDEHSTRGKPRDGVTKVTFEKHLFGLLKDGGMKWEQESGGGRNIFVPFNELERALRACGGADVRPAGRNAPQRQALYINGVFDSVLKEIFEAQKKTPGLVCCLQPFASKRIAELEKACPTSAKPVRLYLSTSDDLSIVRYVADIVGWEDKRAISEERVGAVNSHLRQHQPGEGRGGDRAWRKWRSGAGEPHLHIQPYRLARPVFRCPSR